MPKKSTPQKPKPFISLWTALAIVLLFSLSGCGTRSTPLPGVPVMGVQLPPLPTYARQPTTPLECLPTCLDALMKERESWLTLLTDEALPGAHVNAPTTMPVR